jgi:RNA polymerase sigma-70 factor (ECF subfamily)
MEVKHALNPLQWTDLYADDMYRYAYFCLNGDETLACDLVQDTFLSALEKKDTFKGIASEKTWLFAILRNKIIDHYRKKKARNEISLDDDDNMVNIHYFYNPKKNGKWQKGHEPKDWSNSELKLLEKERNKILLKCLELLPLKWKNIFFQTYIDERKGAEICREFEISSSNYWVILHRCKIQLRECVEKKLK